MKASKLSFSVAGLELVSSIWVSTEELGELVNILDASASVWPVLIKVLLELTLLTELSSGEVNSSNEVVNVDATSGDSASKSIQTLDHVFAREEAMVVKEVVIKKVAM